MAATAYKISGMHCTSCASIIERRLKKLSGVENATVSFATHTLNITAENQNTETLNKELNPMGYRLTPEAPAHEFAHAGHVHTEAKGEVEELRTQVKISLPITLLSLLIMGWEVFGNPHDSPVMKEFIHHLLPVFATYMLIIPGSLIMTLFALGTLPVLAALSFGSFSFAHSRAAPLFFKTSGVVVTGLGVFALLAGLAGMGVIPPLFNL